MRSWQRSELASSPRVMGDPELLAAVTELTGSKTEASWLLASVDSTMEPEHVAATALALARRRRAGEPLQYLIGRWPFRFIELDLDARVLIPRPETEQLVGEVLEVWRTHRPDARRLTLVDLGTGSGAMGLSIRSELEAEARFHRTILTDVSLDALEVAAANARRLAHLDVELCAGSWFDALDPSLLGSVDLLVSNPPYVTDSFRAEMAVELGYEPEGALFSAEGPDGTPGFADVARIVSQAAAWIASGGVLGVEMAEHHVVPAALIAERSGFARVERFVDLAGKPRGIVAVKS